MNLHGYWFKTFVLLNYLRSKNLYLMLLIIIYNIYEFLIKMIWFKNILLEIVYYYYCIIFQEEQPIVSSTPPPTNYNTFSSGSETDEDDENEEEGIYNCLIRITKKIKILKIKKIINFFQGVGLFFNIIKYLWIILWGSRLYFNLYNKKTIFSFYSISYFYTMRLFRKHQINII